MREGFGEAEGDAEPSRAKRAARVSAGAVGVAGEAEGFDGVMDEWAVVSKLTLDFFSALRRARRASSVELGSGILGFKACCSG